jgi:hypothetical protein
MRQINSNRLSATLQARHLACSILAAFVLLLFRCQRIEAAQSDAPTESEVKAAMIYNFAQFIEWPENEPKAPSSFVICVFGEDPIEPVLESTLKGELFQNRAVQVRRAAMPIDARACDIAFVTHSEKKRIPEFLEAVRGGRALTVGDTEDFVALGGMIAFKKEGNRVRFQINPDAATRAGLKISSKLLRLAIVKSDDVTKGGA